MLLRSTSNCRQCKKRFIPGGEKPNYFRLDLLLLFAISTIFRGTCTSFTGPVLFSLASIKTSSPCRLMGSETSSNSFPYNLIFFVFAYPKRCTASRRFAGFAIRLPLPKDYRGRLNLRHTVNARWAFANEDGPPAKGR